MKAILIAATISFVIGFGIQVVHSRASVPQTLAGSHQNAAPPSTGTTKQGLDPNSPAAKRIGKGMQLKNRGAKEYGAGDLKAARRDLEASYKLLPESLDTAYLLGKVCNKLGDLKSSLTYYRLAFNHGKESGSTLDTDPAALSEYAKVAEQVDPKEADQIYARIDAAGRDTIGPEFPKLPEGLNTRSRAHAQTGLAMFMKDQFKSAEQELDEAAASSPNDPVVGYYRALMHAQAGDKATAKSFLAIARAHGARPSSISDHALRFLEGLSS